MKISEFLLITIPFILLTGCSGKHLITDKEYLRTVDICFREKEQMASNREDALFNVFDRRLSVPQNEALKFLFAFMPLSDLADYSGDFFLANADIALKTRLTSPWGKSIPEDIFLHYVLPPRVNNENLDSFRIVYYEEISRRISGLGLNEAALEINHWCHEKVTYQPSDIRTSGPISTILSARGRCGEESTFAVSAIRAAGIPARQVYTPRWAHSDDNHAWVEIWNEGKWYYMGACEPEPQLDLGWFTEPARRAMLIHNKSFGAAYGNENTISCSRNYCEINDLSKYAVTKKVCVKVTDKDDIPVRNASVEFQLYNYAEFYPLTTVPTNDSGICCFETGLGDLLVWARKNENFNFRKISVGDTDTVLLKLNRAAAGSYSEDFDLKVPILRSPLAGPESELIKKNSERLSRENELRQTYINSWIKPDEIETLADQNNLDPVLIKDLFAKSMGNYKSIKSFLSAGTNLDPGLALSLLGTISEKDLRDTKAVILNDHLNNSKNPFGLNTKDELYVKYVLNPRISNEMLTSYREYFKSAFSSDFESEALKDPAVIVKYINETIKIANEENYYKTPLTPKGVHELKLSDTESRAVYFVAICRTMGIPARLEPGSNVPQYFFNSAWNDAYFSDENIPSGVKGFLKISSEEKNPVPGYYLHFTIAKFENGRYNTLEYDYNKRITDFKEELALTPGHYMIVTGNRLDDRKILTKISFFDLTENQHLSVILELRKETQTAEVLGNVDMKKLLDVLKLQKVPFSASNENGFVLAAIEPEREPSKHILNDLPLLKDEFDSCGISFIFFSADSLFNPLKINDNKRLPSRSISCYDKDLQILNSIIDNNSVSSGSLPLIIFADSGGNILYRSAGYRIGIGEQILKRIRK